MTFLHPDINVPSFLDEREIADPMRLREARERWPGLDEAPTGSRIVVLEHGGRARPIIHRGSRHRRSKLVSRQTGLLQITEGEGLPFLCRLWEVDGRKADWQAHPFLVITVFDGRLLVYYPDGVYVDHGGRPVVVEVKRTVRDLADPDYRRKIGAMIELFRRIGWSMRIMYDADVFGPDEVRKTRFVNVETIWSRRNSRITSREEAAIASIVDAGETIGWSAARSVVAPGRPLRGDTVIETAIARGHLLMDVDLERTAWTPLTPNRPAAGTGTFRTAR